MDPGVDTGWAGPTLRRWSAGIVIAAALVCVYAPVLRFDYLYHDDWVHFSGRGPDCHSAVMYGWSLITGRPLGQYLLCGLYGVFDAPDEAWRARLIVLSGIGLFAYLQYLFFEALGLGWRAAVALALGVSVLPGMLVFGYWLTAGSIVFSLVPAAAAAMLTEIAARADTSAARRAMLMAGACSLQIASLLIYQTSAMYFWTLMAVMLAARLPKDPVALVRPFAIYSLVGAAPTAAYFIWFRYLSGFAPLLEITDPARKMDAHAFEGSARWFLGAALPKASRLWFFDFPPGGLAVLTVFVISSILVAGRTWLIGRRRGDRARVLCCAVYPVVVLTLGCLTFLPMLVTNYHLELYRSFIPLSALLFLTSAVHLGSLLHASRWPPIVKAAGVTGFTLGLCAFASVTLVSRMIVPAAAEYAFVRETLVEAVRQGRVVDSVHAVLPRRTRQFTTDEFGSMSVQFPQDVKPMLDAVGRGVGLGPLAGSSTYPDEFFERQDVLVLNFAELAKSGLWESVARPDRPGTPVAADIDRMPRLMFSKAGYSIVAFHGQVFAVPVALGSFGPAEWNSGRVAALPGVIAGATLQDLLAQLPK